jgi:hypothetical protein
LCFHDELSHIIAGLANGILILDWHRMLAFNYTAPNR